MKHHYEAIHQLNIPSKPNVRINASDGMIAEILSDIPKTYLVKFIDRNTNTTEFELTLNNNTWAKTARKYYTDWKVEVTDIESSTTFEYPLELKNRIVYISLDSKALGDTLAWVPYVEEFRKKHDCTVVCSTFWNYLFIAEYPNITFVEPGTEVHNITAAYSIGVFSGAHTDFDSNRHPTAPNTIPLQQVAADILGIPYTEIRPRITTPDLPKDNTLITIALHSTTQSRYWNNPTGWQEVVDWLRGEGYTVKLLSKEGDGYMGNANPTGVVAHPDGSIATVLEEISKSKLFIGISSGLSWLAWAANTPVMLISGPTDDFLEMQECVRISAPAGKCSSCWSRHKFNPGDWNWCPDHKDTPRQFECSKTITSEQVISELKKIL